MATANGILYYDPNRTTAKLATAGLRLAGFRVFNAHTQDEAVELCRAHGPNGDGAVIALLLDAAANPAASASVLKALVQIPGAASLPGILLVSRSNPTPIPGAEGLPSIRRPFSTPALVKVVHESLEGENLGIAVAQTQDDDLATARLKTILVEHFPGQEFSDELVERFSLERVNSSGARLPMDKLEWIAGEYVREMDLDEVAAFFHRALG